jgi:cytochrome c556
MTEVAEALIDWYLTGESDLVVTDNSAPRFGDTAATPTVWPYYKKFKADVLEVRVALIKHA